MKTCESCGSYFDPENVNIPVPIPDYMCAECGTQLTEEQVEQIID